ncbi:LytS family sensor histidine kinase [Ferruginibacter profundus]
MPATKNIKKIISSVHFWLPLSGFTAFWLLLIQLRFINTGSFFTGWELKPLIREGSLILLQMIVVMYFVYYAIRFFDKKFPAVGFSLRRYIYELMVVVLVGFVINKCFHYLFIKTVVVPEDDVASLDRKLRNILLVTQSLIVVMYGLLTAFRIFNNLRQKQTEVLQWQREYAITQFEALKNQLNPHFLFNSLSALTSLVYTDAGKAELFIEKLSKTYRYLLDQREKEAVPIAEEFDFLNNYNFLIEQRYGSKVSILQQGEVLNEPLYMLPHSFLIILEYIIGSNTMSVNQPLKIVIEIQRKTLLVHFNQQPKGIINKHLEQQFSSLQQRYQEMNTKISIVKDDLSQQQTITVQLIQQHD